MTTFTVGLIGKPGLRSQNRQGLPDEPRQGLGTS